MISRGGIAGRAALTGDHSSAAPRTGRDDWLDEGLRLVASLGAPALTLDRICERMALTKRAFYHHQVRPRFREKLQP
jgi:AcrR family transcriptional regulator